MLSASAQQLHESVAVDGKYIPQVIVQDRINTFPQKVSFTLPTDPLDYSSKSVAASFAPYYMPLTAIGWRADRQFDTYPGYLDICAGSWLNTSLSAGYRFVNNENTTIGTMLQFNSTSLYKPHMSEATYDQNRKRYDGLIGVFGNHRFDGIGRLDASIYYRAGYFNYYGWTPINSFQTTDYTLPTQTINDLTVNVGWMSEYKPSAMQYYGGFTARHFAYRSLYLFNDNGEQPSSLKGDRETRLSLNGGVFLPWESGSTIGLDGDFDVLLYANSDKKETVLSRVDNYANLAFRPYYKFSRDHLNVRLGLELAVTINAGVSGDRFSAIHVAPDVKADWRSGGVGLFAHLGGGTHLQTLAVGSDNDYYRLPVLSSTRPVYAPIDAKVGANFGLFAGFTAGFDFAYKVTNNQQFGGWYTSWLSTGENELALFGNNGLDVKGWSVGLNAKYEYGKVIALTASGRYQPQDGKTGYFNGYDRPRWTLDAGVEVNPWDKLKLNVDYRYRGVRNIYSCVMPDVNADTSVSIGGDVYKPIVTSMRLKDITTLDFGVSYGFTSAFTLFARCNNILNRHTETLPLLPTEGISVLAGFNLLF
jgi:hypothetical protein